MKQHSIILLLIVIILGITIYLVNKGKENYRRLDCSACDAGDWANCSPQAESECT